MAYQKLRMYWGKYVLELLSYRTIARSKVVYIAIEMINGHEIGMDILHDKLVLYCIGLVGLWCSELYAVEYQYIGYTSCRRFDPRSGEGDI